MLHDKLPVIPDDAMVPLKMAHLLTSRASSTLYRWVGAELLPTVDSPDGLMVRVGDVRKLTRTVRRGGRRVKGQKVDAEVSDTP